ncbi:hypothetical protein [Mannheimia granulomatis]|uniref:hypothetical protein n=1 Tax=Mannheimia granulomatis TaxID=85402 RepID=UPI00047A0B75|nr:hypothetical protein [Mannheimia granulomatis]QLB18409.1 hypothetical protein A6B41_02585 [Mannheimia granulomatis]
MKVLLFLLCSISMASCSSIISLYPSYSSIIPKSEDQWEHLDTKENVSFELYNECYYEGRKQVIKTKGLEDDENLYPYRYEVGLYHGKCLRKKGFVFKSQLFSKYCYHYSNEVECEAYKKYKK